MNNKKLVRFDWAMKTILRNKANFDVLDGFLCALLEEEVTVLQIIESEGNQEEEDDKFNRVDLLVQDSKGRKIIIEIQNTRESDYLERILYGTSKVIIENMNLGDDFKGVSKVISISILYFNLGSGDDYLYYGTTEFRGMNTGNLLKVREKVETVENFTPKIRFKEKVVFPKYYLIKVDKYGDEIKKAIDEWIYLFKNNEIKMGSISKNIDKAASKLTELNMTDAEREAYERYLINRAREKDMFKTATTEGFDDGFVKGTVKGNEEGFEKGIVKGNEEGFEKGIVKGIVKALKRGKLSLAEIAEDFEVSLEYVMEIQQNLMNP